ncbi:histone_H3 K4-specific methyltransferase SET7/9 N-terminal domain-containing protein [Hexamita inflata]|uniref:Histone H3 K4-specific methyltransferase SET7/9 N-terminal domain-containing protein n=1 Tax=Hexamita inflata TaxID=28002 RepID=A0AA86P512_9EUKA|nr:histone H3 K4-specific methyltransferase SET7/9 N-terminal domain-containing protein [Hexamita inflata]
MFHGKGTLKLSSGDIYKGDFNQDRRHVTGTIKYADGRIYQGEFNEDQRTGCGKLTFPDGTTYTLNGQIIAPEDN